MWMYVDVCGDLVAICAFMYDIGQAPWKPWEKIYDAHTHIIYIYTKYIVYNIVYIYIWNYIICNKQFSADDTAGVV